MTNNGYYTPIPSTICNLSNSIEKTQYRIIYDMLAILKNLRWVNPLITHSKTKENVLHCKVPAKVIIEDNKTVDKVAKEAIDMPKVANLKLPWGLKTLECQRKQDMNTSKLHNFKSHIEEWDTPTTVVGVGPTE